MHVEGERAKTPGGIYYVDVLVRRASWLEELVAPLRPDGARPRPRGCDPRRRAATTTTAGARRSQQMARSEDIAAAVALRELGYDVKAKPDGVIVEAIDADRPRGRRAAADGRDRRRARATRCGRPADLRGQLGAAEAGSEGDARPAPREGDAATSRCARSPPRTTRSARRSAIRIGQSANIKLPIKVDIDLGDVGGPSAGLAFALDVMEELGRDVDHGYKVAATGELELDGSVVPIGGAAQKAIGARRAGVDVLLVPWGQCG